MFLRKVTCPEDKKHVDYFDSGLMLRISRSGTKSFRYTYRMNNRIRQITIGRYPDISLKQARGAVIKAKNDLIGG